MNFQKYAKYYDFFYSKKNYSKEIKTIHKIIKFKKKDNILEVGCGTGGHTREIMNYVNHVDAIDKSKKMIIEAKKKTKKKDERKISYYTTDILKLKSNKKYDKIIMLFHVFGYFVKDKYIIKVFKKINKITKSDSKIIFDYWNSDNIKLNKLKNSSKTIKSKNFFLKRNGKIAQLKKNIFKVRYNFLIKKNKIQDSFSEIHLIRSFNKKSIEKLSRKDFLIQKNFNLYKNKSLRKSDFSGCVIMKKKLFLK